LRSGVKYFMKTNQQGSSNVIWIFTGNRQVLKDAESVAHFQTLIKKEKSKEGAQQAIVQQIAENPRKNVDAVTKTQISRVPSK
jgi:hypothetical protein